MSCLSWNCRGLGNPSTVQVLVDLIHSKKPNIVFLIETFVGLRRLQPIKQRLGYAGLFSVDSIGHRGGLALLWKEGTEVDIKSFSANHIDAEVCLSSGDLKWRFTGFYGCPERVRRSESWNLLKQLAVRNSLPWVVLGDFNDILYPNEKRGGNPQPRRLIEGFSDTVETSGLRDFKFEGYQYTWEQSKGTPNWVEAKLDRILTSDTWCELFPSAKATSVIVSKSDHLPLFLEVLPNNNHRQKARFKFENLWLRDNTSREIMIESWSRSSGLHLMDRIGRCGKAI
ncbi:uncharacterized protein LOC116026992 [Ipomoea triloba]|uniref:uncharacterized protein LOC116026992 n=1 Tax=Ipomoea triloba TaxID=35885 RepID=UPI00125D7B4D|nr:uncharacterized protein LOC116026992 [Ipomoea triloba]